MKQDVDFSAFLNVASNAECRKILAEQRWESGFVCPRCRHTRGYVLKTRDAIECAKCKKQTSSSAGTVFHGMQLLVPFFHAIANICDGKHFSAAEYARQERIDPGTAWEHLHKIRTVIHAEFFNADAIEIPCTLLKMALTKSSSEVEYREVFASTTSAEQIVSVTMMHSEVRHETEMPPDLLHALIAFLLSVFRGVSRKYSQLYLAEFNLIIKRRSIDFRDFLSMCIRGHPSTCHDIADFHSPFIVRVARSAFQQSRVIPIAYSRPS
jgi:transposase-like protein